jgi:DNA/RNA endonuclease G (NUC1)
MKLKILLLSLVSFCMATAFGQGLIIHKQAGLKDTIVISTVDSISFTQSIVVHRTSGAKDSVLLSTIDSLSFDNSINPAPVIANINPSSAFAGSGDFMMTVTGANFINSSVVQWNGVSLPTEYVSPTELSVTVSAANIAAAGSADVTVFTPKPGGGSSSSTKFMIATVTITTENFEKGAKTSYAAAAVALNSGSWMLDNVLIGTSSSDVRNGNASARMKINGKLTMQFDLTSGAGTVKILHAKYGNDGNSTWELWYSTNSGSDWNKAGSTISTTNKTFDTATFAINLSGLVRLDIRKTDTSATYRINFDDITISSYGSTSNNPAPIIASMSPTADTVNAPDFTLTVNGNNFVASSVVNWNGKALTTTFVSATQLKATVTSANLASTGTATVTVFTPNSGTSTGLSFTINPGVNNPVPTIKYMSPTMCTVNSQGFTLTVTGTNFVKNSIVRWNGTDLVTTYVSGTELQGALPAANLTVLGTANVSVFNPAPSGGSTGNLVFTIISGPVPSNNINLTMGNPSAALHDPAYPSNYLIERGQYCLSYNRDKGTANWVSWELDNSWLGSASRGSFMTDGTLPAGWYQVSTGDYSSTGFSRGHMCPSADRTVTEADNDTVFYMTNIVPQTQAQNGGPWEQLETYCRTLAQQGNKLYIVSGVYGEGGTGLNGYMTTIAGGKVTVPAKTWKVIMILPAGSNDLSRVTASTRCIAVIMNNDEGPFGAWGTYRVSVDAVESLTGYDFFSNVPTDIQAAIESVVDNGPTN